MKDRVLDLLFLVGVLCKGIDGLVELIGGIGLLVISPAALREAADAVTAQELSEDPHDVVANLIRHSAAHLGGGGMAFLALYLLFHGVVKLAIVIALLVGSRRFYPWAIVALGAFVVFQAYELVVTPSVGVVGLTILDLIIIWLTWREWRGGRELRDTWRGTVSWVVRRRDEGPRAPSDGHGR